MVNARAGNDPKSGVTYVGEVNFTYTVDGKDYGSNQIDIASYGPSRRSRVLALEDVEAYSAGQEVTVFYDPQKPALGVLEAGIPGRIKNIALVALAIAAVCLPYSIIQGRRYLPPGELNGPPPLRPRNPRRMATCAKPRLTTTDPR